VNLTLIRGVPSSHDSSLASEVVVLLSLCGRGACD